VKALVQNVGIGHAHECAEGRASTSKHGLIRIIRFA
jgi:hypothetical protein